MIPHRAAEVPRFASDIAITRSIFGAPASR